MYCGNTDSAVTSCPARMRSAVCVAIKVNMLIWADYRAVNYWNRSMLLAEATETRIKSSSLRCCARRGSGAVPLGDGVARLAVMRGRCAQTPTFHMARRLWIFFLTSLHCIPVLFYCQLLCFPLYQRSLSVQTHVPAAIKRRQLTANTSLLHHHHSFCQLPPTSESFFKYSSNCASPLSVICSSSVHPCSVLCALCPCLAPLRVAPSPIVHGSLIHLEPFSSCARTLYPAHIIL